MYDTSVGEVGVRAACGDGEPRGLPEKCPWQGQLLNVLKTVWTLPRSNHVINLTKIMTKIE